MQLQTDGQMTERQLLINGNIIKSVKTTQTLSAIKIKYNKMQMLIFSHKTRSYKSNVLTNNV